jgi:hypothetical protein
LSPALVCQHLVPDFAHLLLALATLTGATELFAKPPNRPGAILNGAADFMICYGFTNAYIHRVRPVPEPLRHVYSIPECESLSIAFVWRGSLPCTDFPLQACISREVDLFNLTFSKLDIVLCLWATILLDDSGQAKTIKPAIQPLFARNCQPNPHTQNRRPVDERRCEINQVPEWRTRK